jgi:hypothetical protein
MRKYDREHFARNHLMDERHDWQMESVQSYKYLFILINYWHKYFKIMYHL